LTSLDIGNDMGLHGRGIAEMTRNLDVFDRGDLLGPRPGSRFDPVLAAREAAQGGPAIDRLPPASPRPRRGSASWLEGPVLDAPPPAAERCGCAAAGHPGLALSDVRAIFDDGRFWTEYQAIVDARTGRTAGFEALGRFVATDGSLVAPAKIFALLHADPALLLRAELRLKFHQIEHAPDAPLFLNLDAGSWTRAAHSDGNPFLGLISSAQRRVVVEITESCVSDHALRAADIVASLREEGLTVALDDLGAVDSLFSFDAVAGTDVLKFDRAVVGRLREPRSRALVQMLIRMTHETGAYTVLEGVEQSDELVLARELGFDFVQGFLFSERGQASAR
jgi:EAL domain-containing protein (putative c-di-GMP-specific phosphodiesterase class I)